MATHPRGRVGRSGTATIVLLFFMAVPLVGQEANSTTHAGLDTSTPAGLDTRVEAPDGLVPPQSRRPRRRKTPRLSNVGYIDAAVIGTQLQIRFDRADGIRRPDRAEFLYGKCGCFRELGADPDAPGPTGALNGRDPNTTTFIANGLEFSDVVLDGEVALNEKLSLFAEVPFRSATLRFGGGPSRDVSGIADISVGVKAGLLVQEGRYVTAQLRTYLPTGDAAKGLGTDHWSIEPSLLLYRELRSNFKLEAELRYWIPIGGSTGRAAPGFDENDNYAGEILRYGVGLGVDLNTGGTVTVTPVAELVGWRVLGGIAGTSSDATLANFAVEDASGTNIVNLKLGANISFGDSNAIFVGVGRALTDARHYEDILRVEYRLAR
ncbi:MAG: hypothetical protein BMS9Abin29_0996 [Gemmatimonadota bacterium]|nr:MAG: hypothetical protein BMS9Abin29_0996 [Gemmatimonadota bacterium]